MGIQTLEAVKPSCQAGTEANEPLHAACNRVL